MDLSLGNHVSRVEGARAVLTFEPRSGDAAATVRDMRVALVGNFAPRKCGIATFTTDIFERLGEYQPEVRLDVYALQDRGDPSHPAVHAEVQRDDRAAYVRAARQMNEDGIDALWLQHEFGIFGGDCGEDVLELIDRVAAPLIVTMHTVLSRPSDKQEMITRRLIVRASQLMVMCQAARDVLVARYNADPARIAIIEHGAPDRPLRLDRDSAADAPRTLLTFGLLGPGKGLETAIEALPAIVARHPGVVYRIAGVSHPNELRDHGERYRESLDALAERLGVAEHIDWVNRFLDSDELIAMIEDCDIYLTPYPNLQQSTSGTLSYAVALGRAVVSTPYIHARELLPDAGGVLVEPNDPAAIAEAVNGLLGDPAKLAAVQLRTYRRGRTTVWRHFAGNSKAMLEAAVTPGISRPATSDLILPGLAAFDLLCDGTGMMQHGKGIVPDRNHGYCLDDNVRALMLTHRVNWRNPGEELTRATTFASFLQHAWNEDRRLFRNFMNYDRTWCEDVGSEDSNGRAIWALGDCVAHSRLAPLRHWALQAFNRFAPIALDLAPARSIAFAALGAAAVLRGEPENDIARQIVARCGVVLERLLGGERRPDWAWFEAVIGYDNPRLSQALIECGEVSGKPEWIAAGLESLRWVLEQQCSTKGRFRPVGSESFGRAHDILPFDQQPLEAWAAIEACASAYRNDADGGPWLDHAQRAYRWFLGENDRNVPLVDIQIGSCMDGVTPHGVNVNCGAESLLAFQLSYYSYEQLIVSAGPDRRKDAAKRSQR
jgi:glycosyltransferase involved in cell wall biosynthesis